VPKRADGFIGALRREAAGRHDEFRERVFESVYIGGGTPTVLSLEHQCGIRGIITDHFTIADAAEFTVEANPNTVSQDTLSAWRRSGANRLSLGVQSFSEDVLRILGRRHTTEQAISAYKVARKAGFRNIGMDLIYGVPGQTMEQWKETLDAAIRLGPEHLSLYSLSLDEGSVFLREAEAGRIAMPEDEFVVEMYECGVAALSRAGFLRYEISNFSLPGLECRHNMNYWQRGEYLGLGPSAWSFFSGRRLQNIADGEEYARRLEDGGRVVAYAETPDAEQASRETILLNLRTASGMDLGRYEREHGALFRNRLKRNMGPLETAGLLEVRNGRMTLTDRGIVLSNEALSRLSS
jgi:oxygen-independent coproporphyrinogen-3 oxidase